MDWLHTSGNLEADMDDEDMGFRDFMDSVDCMIMGRRCMEMISNMNLTPEQWLYGDLPIFVLSNTVKEAPENLRGKVEMYSGDINKLILRLERNGHTHAYIDGGTTITSFLNLGLISEMTITKAPVLLGEGLPLFGKINKKLKLENTEVKSFPNYWYQFKCSVNYL